MYLIKYQLKCSSFFLRDVSLFFDFFFSAIFKRLYFYFLRQLFFFFFLKKNDQYKLSFFKHYNFYNCLNNSFYFSYFPFSLVSLFFFSDSFFHSLFNKFYLMDFFYKGNISFGNNFIFNLEQYFFFPQKVFFYSRVEDIRLFFFFKRFFQLYKMYKLFSFVHLPLKIKKFIFLRSPHVDKKAREQLEIRLYRFSFYISFFDIILNLASILGSFKINLNISFLKTLYDYEAL